MRFVEAVEEIVEIQANLKPFCPERSPEVVSEAQVQDRVRFHEQIDVVWTLTQVRGFPVVLGVVGILLPHVLG